MSLESLILSKLNLQQLASEAIAKIDPKEAISALTAGWKKEADALATDPAKQQQFLQSIATIEDETVKVIQIIQQLRTK
jgi:hypothetical protein